MKQEIEQIRSEYDQEDNKIPIRVESALKVIEQSYDTLQTDFEKLNVTIETKEKSVNDLYKEVRTKKTKNQELEREVETLKEDKDKILADTKHEDYDELKKYKSDNEVKITDEKKITRKQFIERHKVLMEHTDYDKCKSGFTLPEEKDGKITGNWDDIDDDTMVANANKLEEQEGYGFFGGKKTVLGVNTEQSGRTETKTDDPYTKDGKSLFNE